MKIGIYGGSFNPPHKAHFEMIMQLLNNHYVDKVIVVPTGDNYLKADLILVEHRINMLNLMFDKVPQVEISNFEAQQSLIYTYDTLKHFQNQYKDAEIYFVCGMDNLVDIENWHNYKDILKDFNLLVFKRDGVLTSKVAELISKYKNIKIVEDNISTLSSTEIRKNISNINLIGNNIDKNVLEYIKINQLYGIGEKNVSRRID